MSIQLIPPEILEEVFKYILCEYYNYNIIDCAKVCKAWYTPAIRVFYENLCIYEPYEALSNLSKRKENVVNYCKKITFVDDEQEIDPKSYKALLSYFPNLKEIDLQNSRNREFHLTQLPMHVNRIKFLQHISPGYLSWTQAEIIPYFKCVYTWRQTIEHIECSALGDTVFTTDNRHGKLLSFIQEFKSLAHLSIANSYHRHASSFPQLVMFSIMRSCPNLVSFSLRNGFVEPDDDITTAKNVDHSKMRDLNITVPHFTKFHIDYATTKLMQLTKIQLSITTNQKFDGEPPIAYDGWMNELGVSYIDRLGRYLGSISQIEFNLFEQSEKSAPMSDYWSFIEKAINKKSQKTHVSVLLTKTLSLDFSSPRITIKRHSKDIFLKYALEFNDYLDCESKSIEDIIPFKQMKDVHSIDIKFESSQTYDDDEKDLSSYMNLFETARKRYPDLYRIDIKDVFARCQLKISSFPIDFLEDYHFRYNIDSEVPDYQNSDGKLRFVFLRKCITEYDLPIVAAMVPTVEYLKLYDCYLYIDESCNTLLDLKSLKLKQLFLCLGNVVDYREGIEGITQTIVIQIEEESGRAFYYKWERVVGEEKENETVNFEPTSFEYLESCNYTECQKTNVVTLKCQKIQKLVVCLKLDQPKANIRPGYEKKK